MSESWKDGRCSFCGAAEKVNRQEEDLCATCLEYFEGEAERELEEARQHGEAAPLSAPMRQEAR